MRRSRPAPAMAGVLREQARAPRLRIPDVGTIISPGRLSPGAIRGRRAALPPYLARANFAEIRERAGRVRVAQRSVTEELAGSPPASFDGDVLLDAQDWMTDAELTALWAEITRTARPRRARHLPHGTACRRSFPAACPTKSLPIGPTPARRSQALAGEDRSSAYGGFHLYEFNPRRWSRRAGAAKVAEAADDQGFRPRRGHGPGLSPAAPCRRPQPQVLPARA